MVSRRQPLPFSVNLCMQKVMNGLHKKNKKKFCGARANTLMLKCMVKNIRVIVNLAIQLFGISLLYSLPVLSCCQTIFIIL